MLLADSHVHLDLYPPEAVDGLIERARAAGVELLLTIGLSVDSSRRAVSLAGRHPGVLAAVGIHPRRLHETDPWAALAALEELARSAEVAALGEVGLEYASGAAPAAAQQSFLIECLVLARRRDLPVVLHVVDAHDDALRILAGEGPVRAIAHYFVGDRELADRYLEVGCLISVGKPVTRPERVALREAVAGLPLDRLLLEADSYPLPDRVTEPGHVRDVCRAVADLRGQPADLIAEATTANLRRLLRIP